MLQTLIDTLQRADGWRRRGFSALAGASAALAFAPFYILPLMVLAYSALVLLIDGAHARDRAVRAAFGIGWWFGFGYYLIGIHWFAFAFLVQAEQFAWMAPFAVFGISGFLALFHGGAMALAARFWRSGWPRVFLLAATLCVFDYLRGHILTGLPWNLPGQSLAGMALSAQTAAFWGVYGLSLVVLCLAMFPAAFLSADRAVSRRALLKGLLVCLTGAVVILVIGAIRLAALPPVDRDDVHLRIVQPNIAQREKIDPALWDRNLKRSVDLSAGPSTGSGEIIVIWPENAAPLLDESPTALGLVDEGLPRNSTLITGAVRRQRDAQGIWRVYNSLLIVPRSEGSRYVAMRYDKHHLVPFGEYLPMKRILRAIGLAQLAPYEDGFTPGIGPQTLNLPSGSVAPLICYEAIFPGDLYPHGSRPEWLLTVTNDAWFGDAAGPRQHLDQARLRSIESGLPMARSANTGISSLIGPAGRLRASVDLYQTGVIDIALPASIAPTLYSRIRDWGFFVMLIAAIGISRLPDRTARQG